MSIKHAVGPRHSDGVDYFFITLLCVEDDGGR